MKGPTLRIFESGTSSKTAYSIMQNQGFAVRAAGLLSAFLVLSLVNAFGQSKESYNFAFNEIHKMLKGESPLDFKRAVFLTENAYCLVLIWVYTN